MSEWLPTLEITQSVANISEEDLVALADEVAEGMELPEVSSNLQGVIVPAEKLKATIINESEFLRFQRRAGKFALDTSRMEDLVGYLNEIVPSDPIEDILTLPPRIKKNRRRTNYRSRQGILTIAKSSEVLRRRSIAISGIYKFLGIPLEMHKKVWSRNPVVAPVMLGEAYEDQEVLLLDVVEAGIRTRRTSALPPTTELEEAQFNPLLEPVH